MTPLLEKWLEAYSRWPTTHQMAFSALGMLSVLAVFCVVMYMVYLGIYHTTVVCRGWRDDDRPTWDDLGELNRLLKKYRDADRTEASKAVRHPQHPSQSAIIRFERGERRPDDESVIQ